MGWKDRIKKEDRKAKEEWMGKRNKEISSQEEKARFESLGLNSPQVAFCDEVG